MSEGEKSSAEKKELAKKNLRLVIILGLVAAGSYSAIFFMYW